MKEPYVILVDENDNQTGICGKMEAHTKALLHRAVSVFIINSKGEWILQRRAMDKYHSNGLWTNTCCTHPHPGESNIGAARRRLKEEMGIECDLTILFKFRYREKLDNGLTEHELDHVFFGITDDNPVINTSEVEEWEAVSYTKLHEDIVKNPSAYTYWFKEIYEKVNSFILQIQNEQK
ncbi:MAG: isopentenyl-diphosphate Delta-isomerase [Bacteroidales bacterium]|nr:isopentenyl-diphosphate Delta-isomerase [Bacteroidales bacterium]